MIHFVQNLDQNLGHCLAVITFTLTSPMDMKVLGSKHLNDMPVSLTLLVPQPLIKSCVLDYKEFSMQLCF